MYTYVKSSLPKDIIFELGTGIAISFSGMALNVLWKGALHIHIYTGVIYYLKLLLQ